ncbi:hypothetical protein CN507_17725, partial [Bacillus cereus]
KLCNRTKKLNKLKQEMERRTFNVGLFQNVWMVQAIVVYLFYNISKESKIKPEKLGWFSDRDNMITAFDGGSYDLINMNYHNICEDKKITSKKCSEILV